MRTVETSGKTIEEAKRKAARQLDVPEGDVEFEVLDVGSPGLFGILGGAPARVRGTYYETRHNRMTSTQASPRAGTAPLPDDEQDQPRKGRGRRPRQESSRRSTQGDRQGSRASGGRSGRDRQPQQSDQQQRAPRRDSQNRGGQRKQEAAPPQERGERRQEEPRGSRQQSQETREQKPARRERKAPQTEQAASNAAKGQMTQGGVKMVEPRAREASELVQKILDSAGLDARAALTEIADDGFQIDVTGDQSSAIIGREGQALDAMQFLLGVIINRMQERKVRVTLEAGGFRRKHRETLEKTALDLASQVVEHNQEAELEPLPPRDRLIIHNALKDHAEVYTYSEGEGDNRHVVISPKGDEQNQ